MGRFIGREAVWIDKHSSAPKPELCRIRVVGTSVETGADYVVITVRPPLDYPQIVTPEEIRPVLRPLESITDDELETLYREKFPNRVARWEREERRVSGACRADFTDFFLREGSRGAKEALAFFDWLDEHGFDYRGLISAGLAVEKGKGVES